MDLNEELTMLLRRCGHFLFLQSNPCMRQSTVLRLLMAGPATQKRIQEELEIQPSSASELITKLEKKGYIRRSRSETDRRAVELELTEEGRSLVEYQNMEEAADVFDGLTLQEKTVLVEILRKLLKSWNGEECMQCD